MAQRLDKRSLFTTQIPRDERLCLFRKTQTNSVMEDEKHMFYCAVLGMSRLEKNYIRA